MEFLAAAAHNHRELYRRNIQLLRQARTRRVQGCDGCAADYGPLCS